MIMQYGLRENKQTKKIIQMQPPVFRNVSNIMQLPHFFYEYAKLLDTKRSLVAFAFVYTQVARLHHGDKNVLGYNQYLTQETVISVTSEG